MCEKTFYEKSLDKAELIRNLKHFIKSQLGGSLDEVRARAIWEAYLLKCFDSGHLNEYLAEALSEAIRDAAHEMGVIRSI